MATRKKPASQVVTLQLDVAELEHLRDVLGVIVPSDEGWTVSESLSASKGTQAVEEGLWEKVVKACESAGVPVGDGVNDFAIVPTGVPTMSVFQIAEEPSENAAPPKK